MVSGIVLVNNPHINKMQIVNPELRKHSKQYIYTSIWSESGNVFDVLIMKYVIFFERKDIMFDSPVH